MRTRNPITLALLASACIAPPVLAAPAADGSVDETYAVSAQATVSVEALFGTIRVRGWDRPEVRLTGSVDPRAGELNVRASESAVRIEVEPVNGTSRGPSAVRLTLEIPAGGRLLIEGIGTDVAVEGVTGPVSVETVNGAIDLDGASGELEASSVSGEIGVRSGRPVRRGTLASVSGSILFDAPLADLARLVVETVSGDVLLRIPEDVSAAFEVSTFSGTIVNGLGPEARRSSTFLPAQELSFTRGAGGATVTIESFSGRVELQPR